MKGLHQRSLIDTAFMMLIYLGVGLFTLFCLIPFWIVVINSFAAETNLSTLGFQLFPKEFSLSAYKYLMAGRQIYRSYGITIFVTVVGTLLAVLVTFMYSYMLYHPKVKYRRILSFLTYFTMLFGAGIVGFYLLISSWLGLKNSIWAMILPYLLNPFYVFIFVSFLRSLPFELNEAAKVDGANDLYIFFRIVRPLCTPVIATICLFYAIQYWNDWYLALLFIDNAKLHPLQMMIRQLVSQTNMQSYIQGGGMNYGVVVPTVGIQLSTVCLTIGPIILLYPFLQKYFVKGLTIGSIKG